MRGKLLFSNGAITFMAKLNLTNGEVKRASTLRPCPLQITETRGTKQVVVFELMSGIKPSVSENTIVVPLLADKDDEKIVVKIDICAEDPVAAQYLIAGVQKNVKVVETQVRKAIKAMQAEIKTVETVGFEDEA